MRQICCSGAQRIDGISILVMWQCWHGMSLLNSWHRILDQLGPSMLTPYLSIRLFRQFTAYSSCIHSGLDRWEPSNNVFSWLTALRPTCLEYVIPEYFCHWSAWGEVLHEHKLIIICIMKKQKQKNSLVTLECIYLYMWGNMYIFHGKNLSGVTCDNAKGSTLKMFISTNLMPSFSAFYSLWIEPCSYPLAPL